MADNTTTKEQTTEQTKEQKRAEQAEQAKQRAINALAACVMLATALVDHRLAVTMIRHYVANVIKRERKAIAKAGDDRASRYNYRKAIEQAVASLDVGKIAGWIDADLAKAGTRLATLAESDNEEHRRYAAILCGFGKVSGKNADISLDDNGKAELREPVWRAIKSARPTGGTVECAELVSGYIQGAVRGMTDDLAKAERRQLITSKVTEILQQLPAAATPGVKLGGSGLDTLGMVAVVCGWTQTAAEQESAYINAARSA